MRLAATAPLEALRAARASVRLALESCGVPQIEGAANLLRTAAAEMLRAEESIRGGAIGQAGELRGEMSLLKQDLAMLGRVIDAGGALYRGLALRLGSPTPGYTPPGSPTRQPAPIPAFEVQG
jgi:hypothetical protein